MRPCLLPVWLLAHVPALEGHLHDARAVFAAAQSDLLAGQNRCRNSRVVQRRGLRASFGVDVSARKDELRSPMEHGRTLVNHPMFTSLTRRAAVTCEPYSKSQGSLRLFALSWTRRNV